MLGGGKALHARDALDDVEWGELSLASNRKSTSFEGTFTSRNCMARAKLPGMVA